MAMNNCRLSLHVFATTALACLAAGTDVAIAQQGDLARISNIVVIYAENRSFDNLYGGFPGANGLQNVTADQARQLDRDGKPLDKLPQIWGGLTGEGVTPAVPEEPKPHLPNGPFATDDPNGFNLPISVRTRDLVHRFYQSQMQIDGGKNDKFVAWGNSGALVMGHYDGSKLPLWSIARKYVLADNFFQGGFGGSFMNHFVLICGCVPIYPDADKGAASKLISAVNDDGVFVRASTGSDFAPWTGVSWTP